MLVWIIPSLFALSLTGLAYTFLSAMQSGADVYAGTYSEDTAREFEDIFLFIPPRRIAEAGWAASATAFTIVFLLVGSFKSTSGFVLGLLLSTVAAVMALQLPRLVLKALRARRLRRFNMQLVDTLISMGNALKAGFSITQAFESIVRDGEKPISQEFDVFLQQTRIGVSFSDALQNLDKRVGSEDLTLVIMAIETSRKTGGNLTEVFEKISNTIRERFRIQNRIRTLTAQGRLQGIIVGAMPVVIGIALMVVDSKLMLPFLRSSFGLGVLLVVIALISLGAIVIRKIIRIDI